jgi:hypothetical protein
MFTVQAAKHNLQLSGEMAEEGGKSDALSTGHRRSVPLPTFFDSKAFSRLCDNGSRRHSRVVM